MTWWRRRDASLGRCSTMSKRKRCAPPSRPSKTTSAATPAGGRAQAAMSPPRSNPSRDCRMNSAPSRSVYRSRSLVWSCWPPTAHSSTLAWPSRRPSTCCAGRSSTRAACWRRAAPLSHWARLRPTRSARCRPRCRHSRPGSPRLAPSNSWGRGAGQGSGSRWVPLRGTTTSILKRRARGSWQRRRLRRRRCGGRRGSCCAKPSGASRSGCARRAGKRSSGVTAAEAAAAAPVRPVPRQVPIGSSCSSARAWLVATLAPRSQPRWTNSALISPPMCSWMRRASCPPSWRRRRTRR
mmetsp:Transcript_24571/g.77233  ORF Transcript_24571/g.77233 Transcript_24571/m.77233 type:complete len:295 (+) Transcript_24571:1080-1964(+)